MNGAKSAREDTWPSASVSCRALLVLGASVATCACSPGSGPQPDPIGDVASVNVTGLPIGSLEPVGTLPVCIARDAHGVYAMTLTCTHAGCNIAQQGAVSPRGVSCGCHGSQFSTNGDVLRGPAAEPLSHFPVTNDPAGTLTTHPGPLHPPPPRHL